MKVGSRAAYVVLAFAIATVIAADGCYSGGGGTNPPTSTFYFPVGLAVSSGGNVLYAVNSDFDLQWNGGTLQAYDLVAIRHDAALIEAAALNPKTPPFPPDPMSSAACMAGGPGCLLSSPINPNLLQWPGDGGTTPCFASPPLPTNNGTSIGVLPGTNCAPPMDSTVYQTDSAIIGAFATDLQISADGSRLFAPVRGSTTVTWADISPDNNLKLTALPATPAAAKKDVHFQVFCGQGAPGGRCSSFNETGDNPNSPENSRGVTMPGEPFGLAQSEDDTAMVVTSQTNTQVSLLTTGIVLAPGQASPVPTPPSAIPPAQPPPPPPPATQVFVPTMQFVASGVANGGNGVVAVPHDPDVVVDPNVAACPKPGSGKVCARPAFLQTSRNTPEIDLLRYYSDDGSTEHRPYVQAESKFPITSISGGGIDSRGIAIDHTQRLACKANGGDPLTCGKLAARVFFANRSAGVLATATVGDPSFIGDGNYNPDLLVFTGNIPVSNGPSKVYIAPIVNAAGKFEVRVFVLCFDASQLIIYDPNAGVVENVVNVGVGPFAMAFDPFDLNAVATNKDVPIDPRYTDVTIRSYRYAYLGSFTQSYVQVIDLDATQPQTFERVVFTLGQPTPPKGQ
jgi:hypothetical protein